MVRHRKTYFFRFFGQLLMQQLHCYKNVGKGWYLYLLVIVYTFNQKKKPPFSQYKYWNYDIFVLFNTNN